MSATPVQIPVSTEDLENAKSGASAYATLAVPADYRLKIAGAEDWLDKATKKVMGWVIGLTISEEAGFGLPFKYFLSFEKERRTKIVRFFEAAGAPLGVGLNDSDPNTLIDNELGGRIDFPRKYYEALAVDGGTPDKAVADLGPVYREVRYVFPLVEFEVVGATNNPQVPDLTATLIADTLRATTISVPVLS